MVATVTPPPSPSSSNTLRVISPSTGQPVGEVPIVNAAGVNAAVGKARVAAAQWAALSFGERETELIRWRKALADSADELADIIHKENGKPRLDALVEVFMALSHLDHAAKRAEKALRSEKVGSGLLANFRATVSYHPLGVIGVIGPWNYPIFTPMGSIAYSLAAGNAVVFKPSELTPLVGVKLGEIAARAFSIPDLLQVVTGGGATGAALCKAGVDKLAFTGSTATGKKVMATCAENLTPVVIEAGGKDALLVDEDADVVAAADAAAWGAFSNAGQTCTGVERVYVHERVHDEFVAELTRRARDVHSGTEAGAQLGPMTMAGQVDVVRRHIDDAVSRGAEVLVGGPDAVGERFIQPTVLANVPEDSTAITEETFGPTVTVNRVRDMDEAVALANGTSYGLGSTVFSRSRGMELARRLRAGMTSVNDVISFAGIPALPFGGVGGSGFGRVHGPDGLKEFTYAKSVARQRMKPLLALTTFDRTATSDASFAAVITALHGRANQFSKRPRNLRGHH